MTNKKKSGTARKDKTGAGESSSPAPPALTKPASASPFTNAQLTTLILVSMAVSRVLQVRSAAEASSPTCHEFYGEVEDGDASFHPCTDPTILSLLKYKYHTAIYATLLATSILMLQCWTTDAWLTDVNALLMMSPVSSGMSGAWSFSSAGNAILQRVAVRKQGIVGLVLFALALPKQLPLWGRPRPSSRTSIPSLTLSGLMLVNLAKAVVYAIQASSSSGESSGPWGSVLTAVHTTVEEHALLDWIPTARPILWFLGVDALTCALLYAFAWHSLPDGRQRSVLFTTAALQLWQALHGIPTVQTAIAATGAYDWCAGSSGSSLATTAMVTAGVAGLAWISPSTTRTSTTATDAKKEL